MTKDDIESAVQKGITDAFKALGLDIDDPRELQADLAHLRKWRKSVEEAESLTFKAIITVVASGIIGAIWLGIKVSLAR